MTAPIGVGIKISTIDEAIGKTGINICTYGPAGVGKTRLCQTIPTNHTAVLVSVEAGLLSLKPAPQEFKDRVQVVVVSSMEEIGQVFTWLAAERRADWLMMDSSSEVAETVLAAAKANTKDPRQAYGSMADDMMGLIRYARDLQGYNVYITAKQGRFTDQHTGITKYGPMMPGQQVGQQMPYMFDELFAMRMEVDQTEGPNNGKLIRVIQTAPDLSYEAKDRSGKLDMFEPADISHIFNKINNGAKNADTA